MSAAAAAGLSDDHVAAVALCGLDELGPRRLGILVERFGSPSRAMHAVQHGRVGALLASTFRETRRAELDSITERWRQTLDLRATRALLERRATHVWIEGDDDYPIADPLPDRPRCLLAEGARVDALDAPRVAIVGTRSATPHGIADTEELAATLADAGITVISGLAIGIDGAAHTGAMRAGGLTVGVVATGLDIEYPRRHRALYDEVRRQGLVLGETGYGIGPTPFRFPVRNRIIAALADVVVVVEATVSGGARITAEHAMRYDRAVFAVPGSRRNASAAGTNALIADGAYPLTDWVDVVIALGMTPGSRRAAPARVAPDARGRAVLDALGGEPAAPDVLAARTGMSPPALAASVARLERDGWVSWEHGVVWPR